MEYRIRDIVFPDNGIIYGLKVKTIIVCLILSFSVQYLYRKLNKRINRILLNRPNVIPSLKKFEEDAKRDLSDDEQDDIELSKRFEKEYLYLEKAFKLANSAAEICFSISVISLLSATLLFIFDLVIGFLLLILSLFIQFQLFRTYLSKFSPLIIRIKTLRREDFIIGGGLK